MPRKTKAEVLEETFIEITPIRAKRLFGYLCRKTETGQEYGNRLMKLIITNRRNRCKEQTR